MGNNRCKQIKEFIDGKNIVLFNMIQSILRKKVTQYVNLFFIILCIACVVMSSFVNELYKTLFFIIIMFSSVIFAIEYFLRLIAAPAFYKDQTFWKSRIDYIFSFYGIIDFVAMMPCIMIFFFWGKESANLIILPYVLILFKLIRYSRSFRMIVDVLYLVKDELITAYTACGIMVVFSAILMYYIEHSAQPEAFANIGDSLWWSIVTFTTVGYGDIYPITPLGKLLSGCISLIGIAMIAIPTGIITSAFMNILQKKKKDIQTEKDNILNN